MGGFANLNERDVAFNRKFISGLMRVLPRFKLGTVLDCGAGIGRIAKEFLCPLFVTVSLSLVRLTLLISAKSTFKKQRKFWREKTYAISIARACKTLLLSRNTTAYGLNGSFFTSVMKTANCFFVGPKKALTKEERSSSKITLKIKGSLSTRKTAQWYDLTNCGRSCLLRQVWKLFMSKSNKTGPLTCMIWELTPSFDTFCTISQQA